MGLKSAPFIVTRSLQIVLNQKNFDAFVKTVKGKKLKDTLKQLKLEEVLICYIDDLLLATSKSFGVELHLALFEFVMEMMCQYGFKVRKRLFSGRLPENKKLFSGIFRKIRSYFPE